LIVLETTRGCPFKCTFCEWGGGIDTKIIKKDIDVVKDDLNAIAEAGYKQVYLADANFGAFEDRDIEILQYAYDLGLEFIDVSTLKTKDLSRKQRIIDKWFNVMGQDITRKLSASAVPHISIQSLSDEAMAVCRRLDLSAEDKIKLSEYIDNRCNDRGHPAPNPEFILAMPGSTKEDFYREFQVIWNFKSWGMIRHQYMFLPDATLSDPAYCDMYEIKLVEVYNDLLDDEGGNNSTSLFKDKKYLYKTAYSSFSYSSEDVHEMFLMNMVGPILLKDLYETRPSYSNVVEFIKESFKILMMIDDFRIVMEEIQDIFDPTTPARSINKLSNDRKDKTIKRLVEQHKKFIYSALASIDIEFA
jgi:hypothetical protein